MRYYLFLDESGEANITNPDPRFNIFVLCGVLFREDHYNTFDHHMKQLKVSIFNEPDIIFHSYEMRAHIGKFVAFKNRELLSRFYKELEQVFTDHNYTIIACIIDKDKYKERYPHLNQAYEDSLKFICERSIGFVGRKSNPNRIHLCLERREKGKDRYLKKYFSSFRKYGTEYYSTSEFQILAQDLHFRAKDKCISGLEFADLCAYPIASTALWPSRPQPTYDLFRDKIYCSPLGNRIGWGLKYFP